MADPAFVLTLSGCDPYDGAYRLPLIAAPEQMFTDGEWHIIKAISGVRPPEFDEAFRAADNDIFVALAVIGIVRSGKAIRDQAKKIADVIWDAPGGSLKFTFEGIEEGPPVEAPQSGAVNESSANDSGNDSSTGSESPA